MTIYQFRVAGLHAALFARATPVMRHGGHILNHADLQTDGLESADGRFAAGAGAFDADFDFAHAVGHGLAGGILRDLLGGEGGAFARALEADSTGAGLAEQVAVHVGDANLGVVKSGQDIGNAGGDVLGTFGLDDLLGVGIFAQKLSGGGGRRGDGRAALGWIGGGFAGLPGLARSGGLGGALLS